MSLVALCNNLDYFRKATTDTGISLIASDLIISCRMRNVGGIDIIGLGTDFDGFSGETDVPDTAHMQHLADVMSHDGFTDEEIEKVFSKNVLRVFRECWK